MSRMHRTATVFLGFTLLASAAFAATREERGSLILENVPAQDTARVEQLESYLQGRGAAFVDWLPDGGMLIATRFAEVAQLHRMAGPLAAREQLTFYREPISNAAVPGTASAPGFVFFKDVGGNENSQIYYYNLTDRSTRLITDGKSLHTTAVWSKSGQRVAFAGNGRDGVSYDIYLADLPSSVPPRLIVNGQGKTWYVRDWSPDDRKLLLQNYVSINESYLYLADAVTGVMTPVDAAKERVGIRAAKFAPDGRRVYVASDRDSEFAQLRLIDLTTGAVEVLTGHIPWDIELFDVSADGRYLAYVANIDGVSAVTLLDQQRKSEVSVPIMRAVVSNVSFDRSGARLALTVSSATEPSDVWVLDVGGNALRRWTQSEVGPLDPKTFVDAELIRFPTFDRSNGRARQIPAFVYRPRTPGPHPVVIDIHGGPESQSQPKFNAFTQYLVNALGVAVIEPNVRGSSGYGKTFLQLDNGRLREDAVKDIGALLVWVGLQRDLDSKRVLVMGGSYGGYMTLASLMHYSDRLLGGINSVGISNFVTFLQNTSAYRRDLRRAEYGDERDPRMRAFLQRISPANNAERITRPLLIVQGINDPRVPASESEQMVAKMRGRGGEVWYLAARDEGHGFRKKGNRDFYLQTVAEFIARQIGAPPPAR
jgi:dipeptidyl aminopeptidase/acylaminoacyl peptidase